MNILSTTFNILQSKGYTGSTDLFEIIHWLYFLSENTLKKINGIVKGSPLILKSVIIDNTLQGLARCTSENPFFAENVLQSKTSLAR